jgi:hypothetical protein
MTVKELKKKNNMPWNKDGSRKKSAFYLRSGNKASYSDLQVEKASPAKWAFLAPLFSALGGGAAGAAGTAAAAGLTGTAATTAAKAGAIAAGKAVATKAITSAATTTAASKLASGGSKKGATPAIVSGEQVKIMNDDEKES